MSTHSPHARASASATATNRPTDTTGRRDRTKDWAKETAGDILQILRHGDPAREQDTGHRFCANCFSQIRTIEPPKPDNEFFNRWSGEVSYTSDGMDLTDVRVKYRDSPETAAAAIGFAYPTEKMVDGVIERGIGTESYRKSLVCECGATRHTTVERPVPKADAIRYARNLSESINTLRDEAREIGRVDHRVEAWKHSRTVLVDTIRALKERPDMQGADKPLFRASLAVALRRPDEY